MTTSLHEDAAATYNERVARDRDAHRRQQLALARSLIASARAANHDAVPALIEAAAEDNQTSPASAAEVFWELVRLRVFDGRGRLLMPRSISAR